MKDYIVRALVSDSVSVYAGITTKTVEEARKVHQMNPTPCVALGRTLTGAALMSRTLKGEDNTITIQIKGDGPIGGIVAVTDAHANVRGYVHNPFFDLPLNEKGKFDIAGAVGRGYLNVIKDIGLKEPYIGYVDLVSGEIAEDLTYYYASSEQLPTAMNLVSWSERRACAGSRRIPCTVASRYTGRYGGFVEERASSLPPITNLIADGLTPKKSTFLFHGKTIQNLGTCEMVYRCNCSRKDGKKS